MSKDEITNRKNTKGNKKTKKVKKNHKFLKRFLLLLLIIIIIIAGYFTYGTIRNGGGLRGFLSTLLGQTTEETENLEPISALVLGSSQNLTDTIMIAKYNPKTQQAYLISVPRDTFVGTSKTSATASDKINSLYQGKYPEKTLAAINKLTGLNLQYYVVVDTDALKALVDAIGGVYFDVPIDMKYTDKKQNLYINLKKGYQLLDGDKAEQVVRFRHNQDGTTYSSEYGDNDIGRMKTQRNFLKTVMQQTLKPSNILKVGEFFDIAQKYIKTNMPSDLLKKYIPSAVNFSTDNLETGSLPGTPQKCNGVWIFIQDTNKSNEYIAELNQKLLGDQDQNADSTKENKSDIKIEILNGSGKTSSLTKLTEALKNKGYKVSKVGKTNSTSKTSIINKGNISEQSVNEIKDVIGTGTITKSNSESSVDITIILGKDYK